MTTQEADFLSASHVTVIEPQKGWRTLDLQELWAYRELLWVLTARDVKVRYKQTVLGFAWAIIQPVMLMIVFSIFFGRLAQMPSDGIPYPIFVYAGAPALDLLRQRRRQRLGQSPWSARPSS